ncbi:MAG: recombination protein RecR, partial [Clostridiales bacterium]|nr:recombination protein RecR [Clostridiales bacterium]
MALYPVSVTKLIEEFEGLPGIGQKTAQRLAFYLLNQSRERVDEFAKAILNARHSVRYCIKCQNLSDGDVCDICNNISRDVSTICVV